MEINGSFKSKKVYFSQVSNHALRDNDLSLKAKGLYAIIQSYITIENFILYKNNLRKQCAEGETAFNNAWKELKTKGYLLQERHSKNDGTFIYEYELLDSIHTPENHPMDNAPDGKRGIYTNTEPTNTNSNNTERYYTILPNDDLVLSYYDKYLFLKTGKHHKRINIYDKSRIEDWITVLAKHEVLISDYKESVQDYIDNLNSKNDGGILAFIPTGKRYFDIDMVTELGL